MKLVLIRFAAILMLGAGLLFSLPTAAPAAAQPHLIELNNTDGTAATPWTVNNIAPGDNGTKTVVLNNSSDYPGSLSIWFSNLRDTPGTPPASTGITNRSRYLADYLKFQVSGTGLNTNIFMPATLNDFPQGDSTGPLSNTQNQLTVARLDPGQSIVLTWAWLLPPDTGNEVQGASLSFDINYGLTEIISKGSGTSLINPSSTPPETHTRIIGLEVPQASTTSGITDQGVVTGTLSATTPDNTFSLSIEEGTILLISNGNRPNPVDLSKIGDTVPARIEVTNPPLDQIPALPEGWVPVSPPYDINAVTNGYVTGMKLDKPASLVIKYKEDELPPLVDGLAAFYYDYQNGWTQLNPPEGFIAEGPEVAAQVDHFSLFIVLARPGNNAPPNIIIQKLTLDPPRITVGQSSDVRIRVTNQGGTAGDYVVIVRVAGKIQKTQWVTLGAGESREIDLIIIPGASGIYTVTAGPVADNLIVDPLIAPDINETNYWWLLCISIGIATLVFSIYRRRKKLIEYDFHTIVDSPKKK